MGASWSSSESAPTATATQQQHPQQQQPQQHAQKQVQNDDSSKATTTGSSITSSNDSSQSHTTEDPSSSLSLSSSALVVDRPTSMPPLMTQKSSSSSSSWSSCSYFSSASFHPYDDDDDNDEDEDDVHLEHEEPINNNNNNNTVMKKSSSTSECYRLPFFFFFFTKKTNPVMTVMNGSESTTTTGSSAITMSRQSSTSSSSQQQQRDPQQQPPPPQQQQDPHDEEEQGQAEPAILERLCLPSSLHYHQNNNHNNDSGQEDGNGIASWMLQAVSGTPSSASTTTTTNNNNNLLLGCVESPSLLLRRQSSSWSNFMVDFGNNSSSSSELLGDNSNSDDDYTPLEKTLPETPTPASDLRQPRSYWIVTTAALPWMTGTAVNPLLRAAHLHQRNQRLLLQQQQQRQDEDQVDEASSHQDGNNSSEVTVTLVVPWLESSEDRVELYGPDWKDSTPDEQETYIRNWLRDDAGMPQEATGIQIQWYPARYHTSLSSIFAMGDLCELVPPTAPSKNNNNMICILEEPEHVNFYRAPGRQSWRDKFPHVIGIIHTNYKAYARNHYSGLLTGPLVGAVSSLMVRAYCDKVIKLSPVLQSYAVEKETTCNVHGIRSEFFHVPVGGHQGGNKIYFIGKLLWAKGLDKLLELQASYLKATSQYFAIDIVGSGPEQHAIQQAFLGQAYNHDDDNNNRYWRRFRQPIPATFPGRKDHMEISEEYSIFVNPSITEVLCTTTAEAIAMGKWVIIPQHSSNEFFLGFSNCLQYSSKKEFVTLLQHAMTHDSPVYGLSLEERLEMYQALTWKAATERLIQAGPLSERDAKRCQRKKLHFEKRIQEWHYALGNGVQGDMIRKVLGGGPVAEQSQYTNTSTTTTTTTPNNDDVVVVDTPPAPTKNNSSSRSITS